MDEATAYRPANGTEGDLFIARWCDRCARNEDGCWILSATQLFRVTDPEYPTLWRADGPSGPRCTAFEAADPYDQPLDPTAAVGLLL